MAPLIKDVCLEPDSKLAIKYCHYAKNTNRIPCTNLMAQIHLLEAIVHSQFHVTMVSRNVYEIKLKKEKPENDLVET